MLVFCADHGFGLGEGGHWGKGGIHEIDVCGGVSSVSPFDSFPGRSRACRS